MKHIIIILFLGVSTSLFGQSETLIRNSSGHIIGKILSTYNESVVYDGSGRYLGVVTVLPSGTYPLDYYLRSQENQVVYEVNTQGYVDAFTDYINTYPEYSDMWIKHSDRIEKKVRRMIKKDIPEMEILNEKLRLIDVYLKKEGKSNLVVSQARMDAKNNFDLNGRL